MENADRAPPGAPALGLTIHAGEDFFHPLDGLRSVAEAMAGCRMRAGDRIGHGLALGLDIVRFNAEYDASVLVPNGVALDSLVWFHERLRTVDGVLPSLVRQVEETIDDLARVIHKQMVRIADLRCVASPSACRRRTRANWSCGMARRW